MKDFVARNKYILYIVLILELCLIPTQITLFYSNREFIDLGLLFTAIGIIICAIPIYNLNKKNKELKKELLKAEKSK
jgi:hypothetical protein